MSSASSSHRTPDNKRPISEKEAARRERQRAESERQLAEDAGRRAPLRLISLTKVCQRINKSRWWVRGERLAGRFPEPVKTGDFVEHEIEAWIEARIAERDAGAAA